jgi:chromosome segregation ATPase
MSELPDYRVSQQRLRYQIAAQRAAIEQQTLALLEMAERKRNLEHNITATVKAIREIDARMNGGGSVMERQRARAQLAALRHTLEDQRLTVLEMGDRRSKHVESIAAAHRALGEFEGQLAGVEQTHGALTDDAIEAMIQSLDAPESSDG